MCHWMWRKMCIRDSSTKKQIKEARDAYEALDETHKAIFNKDTLRKLLAAETGSGNSIEKAMAAIEAIPAADKLTLDDKAAVEKARTLYDSLNDEEKSVITNYSKLTEAEAKIRELEKQQEQKDKDKKAAEKVIADIDALPSSSELTLDPYVLQLLDRVQAEYNALTDAQKALVTNYSTLQYLRNLLSLIHISGFPSLRQLPCAALHSQRLSDGDFTEHAVLNSYSLQKLSARCV